jgi:hypothetical protein
MQGTGVTMLSAIFAEIILKRNMEGREKEMAINE